MPLKIVATPIGNPDDITLRAIEALRSADLVIGEEFKEVTKLLKRLGIENKEIKLLNEHSGPDVVGELASDCREKNVALVSDCGTPGFCDPGAQLVAACRKACIKVSPLPGASSLMCVLSICGDNLREFLFRGFLPADRETRSDALRSLRGERRHVVLMDTPYRLGKLLGELSASFPERRAVLGLNFTQEDEEVLEGPLQDLAARVEGRKAEFILVLEPSRHATSHATPERQGPDHSRNRHHPRRFEKPPRRPHDQRKK